MSPEVDTFMVYTTTLKGMFRDTYSRHKKKCQFQIFPKHSKGIWLPDQMHLSQWADKD